ncbi:hypothetical protein INT45_004664 [Circinella minor]|uniref:Uncharacterized protein n=1 Tax=Circinella minor TaxID=1195481 RepID=A0A8H7VHA6_9FUNG|nr:hypothetical protein INT45_004664 [Circinella minor]
MRRFTSVVALVSLALFAISSVSATGAADVQGLTEQKRDVNVAPIKRDEIDDVCDACSENPNNDCTNVCGF